MHRGITDQWINSGMSDVSTEKKSQLQRNNNNKKTHLGTSPDRGLSDLDVTRGAWSRLEELLHRRIGLLNPFHCDPKGQKQGHEMEVFWGGRGGQTCLDIQMNKLLLL